VNDYVFRSEWRLPAGPDEVYAVLEDVENYPAWWPQVVRVRRIDDLSGEMKVRSRLPYTLTVVLQREVEDPVRRVLRARLDGDMTGMSQWTVSASGPGSVAVFDEAVDMRRRTIRTAGRFARPALVLNHSLMMRAGERGLRSFLTA
jgi:Polyketide cyclase / dehydrase and lipid transport